MSNWSSIRGKGTWKWYTEDTKIECQIIFKLCSDIIYPTFSSEVRGDSKMSFLLNALI